MSHTLKKKTCPQCGSNLVALEYSDKIIGRLKEFLAGQYDVIELAGHGVASHVYRAIDKSTGKAVALKVSSTNEPGRLRRFKREIDAQMQLNHPNITRIFNFSILPDGHLYSVMEYVEGITLQKVLSKLRRLPLEYFAQVFSQACDALAHAHEQKILHWDIKPKTIMISLRVHGKEKVKLIGFGKGESWMPDWTAGVHMTEQGALFGDAHYTSPELGISNETDARSNVYSLGCVMYEAITGTKPFVAASWMALVAQHINAAPAHFVDVLPEFDVPSGLEALVFRAIEKQPDRRFQTMLELKASLSKIKLPESNQSLESLLGQR